MLERYGERGHGRQLDEPLRGWWWSAGHAVQLRAFSSGATNPGGHTAHVAAVAATLSTSLSAPSSTTVSAACSSAKPPPPPTATALLVLAAAEAAYRYVPALQTTSIVCLAAVVC